MKISGFAIVLFFLAGCSYFTPPNERPVIEDKLNRGFIDDSGAVGTLSLTPERRVVLVHFGNERFCAEAPTEVGQDISRLVQAAANASDAAGQKIGLGAVIAGNYSNSVLNRRTQGVQLFQSSSYFLCQMYMNEAIDGPQLLEAQIQLINAVAPLIEKEIPLIYRDAMDAATTFQPLDFDAIIRSGGGGEFYRDGDGGQEGEDNDGPAETPEKEDIELIEEAEPVEGSDSTG